jgi:hypothetical protein
MRMIMGITALVLVWVFSMSGDLWALSLENIAAVVQMNSCQDCEEVEQQNLAFIFQDISSNNAFMYIPALTTSDETFMNKIANIASVVQENFCIECRGVEQQNIVLVIQEIGIDDPLMSSNVSRKLLGIHQNEVSNITDVTQTNECIICENIDQTNLLFILQNIGPEDLFISTPAGIIQGSLFIDLVNIAMNIFRRTSEPYIQDVEWTQGKLGIYLKWGTPYGQ